MPPACRSVFHGRETSQRIATAWASHTLVKAVRLLVRDALADPRNKRFILLSGAQPPCGAAGRGAWWGPGRVMRP